MEDVVPFAERISAYDGSKLNLVLCYPHLSVLGRLFMPRKAIGCALSHYHTVIEAYRNGDQYAVILEDDARPVVDDWQDKVQQLIHKYPKFDVVKLHYNGPRREGIKLPLVLNGSTAAYLISRRGMKKMLKTKVWTHYDIQLWIKQITTWDVYKADLFKAMSKNSTIRPNKPWFEKVFDVSLYGYMPLYFYLLHPMARIPLINLDLNIVRMYCTTLLVLIMFYLLV